MGIRFGSLRDAWRHKRRIGVVASAVGIAIAASAVVWMTNPDRRPKAETARRYDWGQVWKGEPVEFAVHVRNSGTAPLGITKIDSDCGCTASVRGESLVAPGGVAEIVTRIATETLEGRVEKRVSIFTNDPAGNPLTLTIAGVVRPEFVLSDPVLNFGSTERSATLERRITVKTLSGTGKHIVSVRSTTPGLTATMQRNSPVEGTTSVLVRFVPRSAPPFVVGNIVIETSSLHMPVLRIPVRAVVGVDHLN